MSTFSWVLTLILLALFCLLLALSYATLTIPKTDIFKIQAHFGRAIPALFVFASPNCCAKIRTLLKMNKSMGLWLEMTSADESMKRITILPEKINDETKAHLLRLYGGLIEEIDNQRANDILVKSSPKDSKLRIVGGQFSTLPGAMVTSMKRPGDIMPHQVCNF